MVHWQLLRRSRRSRSSVPPDAVALLGWGSERLQRLARLDRAVEAWQPVIGSPEGDDDEREITWYVQDARCVHQSAGFSHQPLKASTITLALLSSRTFAQL